MTTSLVLHDAISKAMAADKTPAEVTAKVVRALIETGNVIVPADDLRSVLDLARSSLHPDETAGDRVDAFDRVSGCLRGRT